MPHEAEPATVYISDYARPDNPEAAELLVASFAAKVYRDPAEAHQTLTAAADILTSDDMEHDLARSALSTEQQAFVRQTAELLGATAGGRCIEFDDATEEAIDNHPVLGPLRLEVASAAANKRSDYADRRLKAAVSHLGFFTARVVAQQTQPIIPKQRNKSTKVSS